ncbi:stress protein [Pollutimonas nitritireducens]|uniref:Stress protein n=1 Tax=Pollutimonas nitritireducens TaxID=2045209 RepID=A0A2N4UH14_9BURK|nr:Hsp20/alpha crystallin family protein [Pollutimonas nitritireducens]PLC54298.1 stress protein [Pollutimonas nitritireducens]
MANNLMQFDPFSEIANLSPMRGLDDLFKDFRLRPMMGHLDAEPRIKMDVSETEQGYTIKAEIPGVKKEDVKVAVEGNQVTIAAETKRETEEKEGETVVRRERYMGHQSRSFTLAHEIDDSKAVAKYQDGILELSLPKKPSSGGRKVLPIS